MIKVLNCKGESYKKTLENFLNLRRFGKSINTSIVSKILNDIKKNKLKALIKYENKFSKNKDIFINKNKVDKSPNLEE